LTHKERKETGMKIFIGADHRGYALKKKISSSLTKVGHQVVDVGTHQDKVSCDYPRFSYKVAQAAAGSKNARGILICMTGIGHAIAANKVPGAYAALCYNKQAAVLSREHNNANILVIGAKFVSFAAMKDMIRLWLVTPFAGGRHARRVAQIKRIERRALSKKKK